MISRKLTPLVIFWAAGLLALNGFVFVVNDHFMREQITEYFDDFLRSTLDDSLFGNNQGVVNDRSSLLEVGERINRAVNRIVMNRWYSALDDCELAVSAIDDVAVRSEVRPGRSIVVALRQNAINRPVVVDYACTQNFLPYLLWTTFAVVLFMLLYRALPYPLSPEQRRRRESLFDKGYDFDDATRLVAKHGDTHDALNSRQRAVLAQWHKPELRNYEQALRLASLPAIAALDDAALAWFLLALRQDGDVDRAQLIALHADTVEIDLTRASLRIHGLDIPIHGTPLFYYAWYALKRVSGDGWVTNPRSNRPDISAGAELESLLRVHHGHARAVSDLEQSGLKARTLDQNRSKIRDAISAVLGEKLADKYLFEARKDPLTRRMCYRIALSGESLVVRKFG